MGRCAVPCESTPIAKKQIALHSPQGQFITYITNHDAWERVSNQQAHRISDKAIQLVPNKTTYGKVSWQVRQSGYAGPLVLQVTT